MKPGAQNGWTVGRTAIGGGWEAAPVGFIAFTCISSRVEIFRAAKGNRLHCQGRHLLTVEGRMASLLILAGGILNVPEYQIVQTLQ